MLQFHAKPFLEAMSLTEQLRMATHDPKLTTFDAPALSHVKAVVDQLTQQLDQLGLRMAAIVGRRLRAHLDRNPQVGELKFLFLELHSRIHDEIESTMLLQIPYARAEYYTQPAPLFGPTVAASFPSCH